MTNDEVNNAFMWKEPPVPTRRNASIEFWDSVVDRLKSKPGSWARVRACASKGTAQSWKKKFAAGKMVEVPNGLEIEFKFTSPEGEVPKSSRTHCAVYVRLVREVGVR